MVTVNYYLHYSCINVPNFTNILTFYTFFHYWLQLQSYLHQVNESTLVRVYMWFIVLVQVHYHIFCLTTNGWIYLFLMNRIWATIQSIEWQLIERFAVMRWCVSTKKKKSTMMARFRPTSDDNEWTSPRAAFRSRMDASRGKHPILSTINSTN